MKREEKSIDLKSIQMALIEESVYNAPITGVIDPATRIAIDSALHRYQATTQSISKWRTWVSFNRKFLAWQQIMLKRLGFYEGVIDGLYGPSTDYGMELWQNKAKASPAPIPAAAVTSGNVFSSRWPLQANVPNFFGEPGARQIRVTPPYQLFLYDTKQPVKVITLHELVAPSALRVLENVKRAYTEKQINQLHLDRFFGSLNIRRMRGSASAWSMHSWGIAIDWDANRNQLRWGRNKAALARPEYGDWWKLWEEEGWVSLGRERNFDWMHVQAARLV